MDHPYYFAVEDGELDLNQLVHKITTPSTGAACLFTGMVRGVTSRNDPHETEYLEYEAYIDMAREKINQVAEEIWERWPEVEGIACSAGHRDSGVFEASRYGIDRLKQIVPIWKKEIGPDGEVWIEGNYFPKIGE